MQKTSLYVLQIEQLFIRIPNVLLSILTILALSHSHDTRAFSIGPTAVDFGGDVHQNITSQALSGIVIPSQFGRPTFTMAAIKEIVKANIKIKIDDHQDRPSWHCDNNDLNGCSQVIDALKQKIIAALRIQTPFTLVEQHARATRKSLGEALHTLQDFYAHSNWVENNATIAAFLGNSSVPRFDATSVARNCDPNTSTLSTSRLISEYAITIINFTDLQSAWAERYECAHGLIGNGIHKDWDGRANYAMAYQLAYVATFDFIKQQEATDPFSGDQPAVCVCPLRRGSRVRFSSLAT